MKDNADIDCVVFLNNLKTMKEHKRDLAKTKNCLESCLKRSPYKKRMTFDKQTHFAVQFKLRLDYLSPEFDIDLLPTFTSNQSRGKKIYKIILSYLIDFNLALTQPTTTTFIYTKRNTDKSNT